MSLLPFIHISNKWLRMHLPLSKLIDTIEAGVECYSSRSEGGVTQPLRTQIPDKSKKAVFASAVAHIDCQGVFVNKMFSHVPANADKGLPKTHSSLAMFDSNTGELVAIVDGDELTRLHQSALAAAASRLLAPPDATTLALIVSDFGDAEALLTSHLIVLKQLKKVNICLPRGPSSDAQRLVETLKESFAGLTFEAFSAVEPAVNSAHVVCLSCGGDEPLLQALWLKEQGVHVTSMGSFLPSLRELHTCILNDFSVVVDSREASAAANGDIKAAQLSTADLPEIGELIGCRRSLSSSLRTVFCSVGLAVQDGMAARLALRLFQEKENERLQVNCAKH